MLAVSQSSALNLARQANGVRRRVSKHTEDQTFSDWHRTLDRTCYMTDIDVLEYRFKGGKAKPVLLIEYKRWHVQDPAHLFGANSAVKLQVAKSLNIDFLHVNYKTLPNGLIEKFLVYNVSRYGLEGDFKTNAKCVSEKYFRRFLEAL